MTNFCVESRMRNLN